MWGQNLKSRQKLKADWSQKLNRDACGNVGLVKPKESWSILIFSFVSGEGSKGENGRGDWKHCSPEEEEIAMEQLGTQKKLISERDMRKSFKILRIL